MTQQLIINILALLVTLGILVTVHEFGHFWVARRCGVKVLRFSIGFGKAVKSWTGKDGTEYVIAPIPLGGYVKMLGQDDTSIAGQNAIPESERHLSFSSKPLAQRMAIVAAGPLANFLLAIFVFWVINISYGVRGTAPVIADVLVDSPAWTAGLRTGDEIIAVDGSDTQMWQQVTMQLLERLGESGQLDITAIPAGNSVAQTFQIPLQDWQSRTAEPDPLGSLGLIQYDIPAVIAAVVEGGRAEQAGLRPGDRILSVSGVEITGWGQWVRLIRNSPELLLPVVVQRDGVSHQLELLPERSIAADGQVIGLIGAAVQPYDLYANLPAERRREIEYNPITALLPAVYETWDKSVFVLDSIKKMLVGLISVKNINGPITIAQVAGETAGYGLEVYLGFLAVLSISLGVLNLLPIPVLDGGHLLYFGIEAITRKPVPERIQAMGLQLGLLLISGIMMLAIYNDVSRLL
ncbi:MAG: RIP metalloprotease RseP [Pseudomonadales bacterium]|nr:RIP metalloprotease RseP [Pseudomonadales bacterium]